MPDPDPATQGNISIGDEFTVENGLVVTEGYSSGSRLSLPGFNGPFPPADLLWGDLNLILWGSSPIAW